MSAPVLVLPRRRLLAWGGAWGAAGLAGCVLPDPTCPRHAFELAIAREIPYATDVVWVYGSIDNRAGPKPRAVSPIAFVLIRQSMPLPAFFHAEWTPPDGRRRVARQPVAQPLARAHVEGKSVLFELGADEARGYLVTYTARGDVAERFV